MSNAMENSKIIQHQTTIEEEAEIKHAKLIHSITLGAKRRWIQWIKTIQQTM
jgi:hypothetical protein